MLTRIKTKIRNLIEDNGLTHTDVFTYSSSAIFTLTEVYSSISSVTKNGSTSGVTYTASTDTNAVTVTSSLTANDIIRITYTYYKYSDTELNRFINNTLIWLNSLNYKNYELEGTNIYPKPTLKEQNLISTVCWILIEPDYNEYRLGNTVIKYPNKKTKEEKIQSIVEHFKMGSSYSTTIEQE